MSKIVDKKQTETRARAEKAIAATTDIEVLSSDRFAKHPNKHVRQKAQTKIQRVT